VLGRYGWVGGTGTSAYVHPDTGAVAILLTQVVIGAPGIEDLMKAFWTYAATVA
jgi:CubicO group peptidase (beta-lactamase class C family)